MGICVYIIIPIYNVENYLKDCIESVLKQQYSNIKIILVNDGSTDSSYKIIENYKFIKNIHIINKPNGGLSSARNAGINFVFANRVRDNDIIVFLDSDDMMNKTYIQSMLKALQSDADLALGDVYTINQNGKLLQKYSNPKKYNNGKEYLSNIKQDYFSFSWGGV